MDSAKLVKSDNDLPCLLPKVLIDVIFRYRVTAVLQDKELERSPRHPCSIKSQYVFSLKGFEEGIPDVRRSALVYLEEALVSEKGLRFNFAVREI